MINPTDLAALVALSPPASWGDRCPAWMDSADRPCGRDAIVGHLCKRHHTVALRRLDKLVETRQREAHNAAQARKRLLPKWRADLAKIEARIRQIDPPPPTTDPAAYGGVGSTAAKRYRARFTDARIHELATLHEKAQRLRRQIGES